MTASFEFLEAFRRAGNINGLHMLVCHEYYFAPLLHTSPRTSAKERSGSSNVQQDLCVDTRRRYSLNEDENRFSVIEALPRGR